MSEKNTEREKLAAVLNSQKGNISVDILSRSFGEYQTNCYICKTSQGEVVIDAGVGADKWVMDNCKSPLAFLNTHGHFDHIWSNALLKAKFPDVPLVCPALDAFMLESDCFGTGVTPSVPDILALCQKSSQSFTFGDMEVVFSHFPGHTPGCSMIEINGNIFSGDFIFHRYIGRSDFPYSSTRDMIESLLAFCNIHSKENKPIYPGHGIATNLKDEQMNAKSWIAHLSENVK